MKKLVLLVLLVNHFLVAYNQIIKGTILDKETEDKIAYATVYFNGTFVGTYSDQNGNFQIDVSKNASMPLSISAVGYNSSTVNSFSSNNPLIIYLTRKVYNLSEVVINAKSLARERRSNLELFKNVFLGTTSIAHWCKIINENDITFNYKSDKDTLKAFASKPLQIENRALGYKITYFLDKFEYDRKEKTFFFKGNIVFNEDMTTEEIRKQSYERHRRNAYMGSRMHFFRELWADNLNATGFVVQNSSEESLNYEKIVLEENDHKRYLSYRENLIITYYSKDVKSYIIFLKDRVFFDGSGYFDASGISWEGQMITQRIGDLLPYEYVLITK
ncbi:MAG: carboxypeptidase-like regulatory domain-containing protein [Bacteroidia bacterium]|nr:carboxypeptidase-like regulatory domain-containing protein [Bacteroidia bacterium]